MESHSVDAGGESGLMESIMRTELLILPSGRECLVAGMADRTVIGSILKIRVCDIVASWFAAFDGAPKFKLDWTTEDRDKAIEQMKSYVLAAGSKLADLRPKWGPMSRDE